MFTAPQFQHSQSSGSLYSSLQNPVGFPHTVQSASQFQHSNAKSTRSSPEHATSAVYSSSLPTSNLICLTFPLELSSAYTYRCPRAPTSRAFFRASSNSSSVMSLSAPLNEMYDMTAFSWPTRHLEGGISEINPRRALPPAGTTTFLSLDRQGRSGTNSPPDRAPCRPGASELTGTTTPEVQTKAAER